MGKLGKRMERSKVIIRFVLSLAIILSVISTIPLGSTAKASGGTIQYNNKVFTKKLYKNTKKIGFSPDGSQIIKDKKIVKKVYALLAKMELEEKEPDTSEKMKAGHVSVVIHTKDGKELRYRFQGKEMGRRYIITKNHPIDKIREIYEKKKN